MVPSRLAGAVGASFIGGVDPVEGPVGGAIALSGGAMAEAYWVESIAEMDGSTASSSAGWQAASPAAPGRAQVLTISRIVHLSCETFAATLHGGSPPADNPARSRMLHADGA